MRNIRVTANVSMHFQDGYWQDSTRIFVVDCPDFKDRQYLANLELSTGEARRLRDDLTARLAEIELSLIQVKMGSEA